MTDLTDDDIIAELGLQTEQRKDVAYSHEQARIISGFEEIIRFVDENGRQPQHGEERDIFERLYAVRLDRIRGHPVYCDLVRNLDKHNLLDAAETHFAAVETLEDDELLAELGLGGNNDITNLAHVRPRAEVLSPDKVADRKPCEEFIRFKPYFEQVQSDLDRGVREARPFGRDASIDPGEFFILGGQMVYVAEAGEEQRRTKTERPDRRLRVIYDNGTESDILMRSLQRALHKDEHGRRITNPDAGPLFGGAAEQADTRSGTIYVLKSRSPHPLIAKNRDLIHKIGVTGGKVDIRVGNAGDDPTYLFANVEVVATYELFNLNRSRLENLLHRVFAPARLNMELPDRFGRPYRPREWFLVPLAVINEVVERIRDGSITRFVYEPATASLREKPTNS